AVQEVVDQDLISRQVFQQVHHGLFQILIIDHDAHSLSSQYVGWANKYWITNFICHFNSLLSRSSYAIFRIWNIQFLQQVGKATTIFSHVHILERCTNDLNTELLQLLRHFQSRLATQLNDHTFWFFMLDDLANMFPENGLKIQLVCHIEVRRYGFRITIDHYGFITTFLGCKQSVYTRVVKFDTLANAVWS